MKRHQRHFPKCRTIICAILFIIVPFKMYALLPVAIPDDSIDIKNRMKIQNYIEKAVAAHPEEDKKLLAEFWSVAVPECDRSRWVCGNDKPHIQTYWNTTLRKAYEKDKNIRVLSKEISIVHHPLIKWVYGVTLYLDVKGVKYSDSGYMFMVWDFRNPDSPQILVRTWQPEYIDKEKVRKLDPDNIFVLPDFDL